MGIQQTSALAAKRFRQEESVVLALADERRRMELEELEVGEEGSSLVSKRKPCSDRSARVGRPLPKRRRPTGREQGGTRWKRCVLRNDADAPVVRRPEANGARPLVDRDALVRERDSREHLGDLPAGGAPTRVHDPALRVAAFEREQQPALRVPVPRHSQLVQLAHALGRFLAQDAGHALARRVSSGRKGVAQVELGRVVASDRRREAALGAIARGLRER